MFQRGGCVPHDLDVAPAKKRCAADRSVHFRSLHQSRAGEIALKVILTELCSRIGKDRSGDAIGLDVGRQ